MVRHGITNDIFQMFSNEITLAVFHPFFPFPYGQKPSENNSLIVNAG